jgi:uncharacterized protein
MKEGRNNMKKLIQVLIVCGLFAVMGGTASGETLQDGLDAYEKKDYKTALAILKPLADQGNLQAQTMLGKMYAFGGGVKKDKKEAIKFLSFASEKNFTEAMEYLARLYSMGTGPGIGNKTTEDSEKEIDLYLRLLSLEPDNSNYMYSLGSAYDQVENYSEALKLYKNSIEKIEDKKI